MIIFPFGIIVFLYGLLLFACIKGGKLATMGALTPFIPFVFMGLYYWATGAKNSGPSGTKKNSECGYAYKYEYRYGSKYPNDHER